MSVTSWSTTPAANTSLATFNLSEGATMIADFNGITRQLMADIKAFSLTVPVAADYVTRTAGVFSGTEPTYTGRGAYAHWNNSALASGRMYLQASGGSMPSGALPGTIVFEY